MQGAITARRGGSRCTTNPAPLGHVHPSIPRWVATVLCRNRSPLTILADDVPYVVVQVGHHIRARREVGPRRRRGHTGRCALSVRGAV